VKSVVLLSGGLDSATNLYKAHQETEVLLALTFDYGQKAAAKEIQAAHRLCQSIGIPHKVIAIPWVREFGKSSLIDPKRAIPQGDDVLIDNYQQSLKTAAAVWVPNRNGIMLNIGAGFAEALLADFVIPGFNIEEAQTFPDNTAAFLDAMTQSLSFSTSNQVRAHCYTADLNKTKMVALAKSLVLPFELLWPCYFDQEYWCGICESCLRFKRALESNSLMSHYQNQFMNH
jgi:7-cyano-7-deazaguanine synthase